MRVAGPVCQAWWRIGVGTVALAAASLAGLRLGYLIWVFVLVSFWLPALIWCLTAGSRWWERLVGALLAVAPLAVYPLLPGGPGDRTPLLVVWQVGWYPVAVVPTLLVLFALGRRAGGDLHPGADGQRERRYGPARPRGWRLPAASAATMATLLWCCGAVAADERDRAVPADGEILPLPAGLTLVSVRPMWSDTCESVKVACGQVYRIQGTAGMTGDETHTRVRRHLARNKGWGTGAGECRTIRSVVRGTPRTGRLCVVRGDGWADRDPPPVLDPPVVDVALRISRP